MYFRSILSRSPVQPWCDSKIPQKADKDEEQTRKSDTNERLRRIVQGLREEEDNELARVGGKLRVAKTKFYRDATKPQADADAR